MIILRYNNGLNMVNKVGNYQIGALMYKVAKTFSEGKMPGIAFAASSFAFDLFQRKTSKKTNFEISKIFVRINRKEYFRSDHDSCQLSETSIKESNYFNLI